MDAVSGEFNGRVERDRTSGAGRARRTSNAIAPGALIEVLGAPHRMLAEIGGRILLIDLRTHHVFLTQDAEGESIQLPTIRQFQDMIRTGSARTIGRRRGSAEARMRVQIDMLDAARVAQGDKAIWIHLAANWTPDLEARFGPHDEAWKIRRWRAALRLAEAARGASDRRSPSTSDDVGGGRAG